MNTMNKLLNAFASRAESISLQRFLELFVTPHHRRSIGIICDPWQQSPASVLNTKAFHIAVSLLPQIGMDLTSLQFLDEGEASDRYPAWWNLQTLYGVLFSKGRYPYLSSRAWTRNLLTIDNQNAGRFCLQINYFSELSDLLNIAPGKMGETLGTVYPRIVLALDPLYGCRLRLKELEHRVHVITIQMNTPVPVERTCEAYLG
jgi:hypothetical protein